MDGSGQELGVKTAPIWGWVACLSPLTGQLDSTVIIHIVIIVVVKVKTHFGSTWAHKDLSKLLYAILIVFNVAVGFKPHQGAILGGFLPGQ